MEEKSALQVNGVVHLLQWKELKSDHLFFPDPPNTLEKDEASVEQKYLLTIGKKEGTTQSATGSFII